MIEVCEDCPVRPGCELYGCARKMFDSPNHPFPQSRGEVLALAGGQKLPEDPRRALLLVQSAPDDEVCWCTPGVGVALPNGLCICEVCGQMMRASTISELVRQVFEPPATAPISPAAGAELDVPCLQCECPAMCWAGCARRAR